MALILPNLKKYNSFKKLEIPEELLFLIPDPNLVKETISEQNIPKLAIVYHQNESSRGVEKIHHLIEF